MRLHLFAGLALACLSLGACAGLPLTGNPAADAKTAAANIGAVNASLGTFNQHLLDVIIQSCGLDGELNVAIPNPVPTGNLKLACHVAPGGLTASAKLGVVAPGVPAGLPVGDAVVTVTGPAVTPAPAQPPAH